MIIRVLGSAAGGGFPQWNCGCPNCQDVRSGHVAVEPRTQDSVAVSADGRAWFLLNASPEVLAQIARTPALHPRAPRHSPIAGIALTNGDLDHVLGLFSLRESTPLQLFATEAVRQGLEERNAIFRTLHRFEGQTTWRSLVADVERPLVFPDGAPSGLRVTACPVPGKLPVHLVGLTPPSPEDNVALRIVDEQTGGVLVYATAVGRVDGAVRRAIAGATVVLFDGSFWSSDELPRLGLGAARAEDMAHQPVGGPGGSLAALADLPIARRVLTHLNNSNPLLRGSSEECASVARAGWEVAHDGMEIEV
jgi:pyrroloquinoline quinone biosynthesis protein B